MLNSNLSAGTAADSSIQPIAHSSADIEANPMLGDGIINYDGRLWLVEKYDNELYGGGWFASPIYQVGDKLEVRPAGGNWCYKINGAKEFKLEPEKRKQVYESWIAHLEWSNNFIGSDYPDATKDYLDKISFWRGLSTAIA